jgi:hypothetical protein
VYGLRRVAVAEDTKLFNSKRPPLLARGLVLYSFFSAATVTEITFTKSVVFNNGVNGIVANGAASFIRIANVDIFANGTGIKVDGGKIIGMSLGANANPGNTTPCAPTDRRLLCNNANDCPFNCS